MLHSAAARVVDRLLTAADRAGVDAARVTVAALEGYLDDPDGIPDPQLRTEVLLRLSVRG